MLHRYYLDSHGQCLSCPQDAYCAGGYSLPQPKAGFWSDRKSPNLAADIIKCPYQTCIGTNKKHSECWDRVSWNSSACTSDDSRNASRLCRESCLFYHYYVRLGNSGDVVACCWFVLLGEGTYGPLCSICKPEFMMHKAKQYCERCPSSILDVFQSLPVENLVVLALCPVLTAWLTYSMCCKQGSEARLEVTEFRLMRTFIRRCKTKGKIVWATFQVNSPKGLHCYLIGNSRLTITLPASQISSGLPRFFELDFPSPILLFAFALDFVNLDIDSILAVECISPVRTGIFYRHLVVSAATPAVACGLCFLVYSIKKRAALPEEAQQMRSNFISILLLITFILYVPVSSTIFAFFDIHRFEDGSCHLRADCAFPSPPLFAFLSQSLCRFLVVLCVRFDRLRHSRIRTLAYFCHCMHFCLANRRAPNVLGRDVRGT